MFEELLTATRLLQEFRLYRPRKYSARSSELRGRRRYVVRWRYAQERMAKWNSAVASFQPVARSSRRLSRVK